jgi:plasmid stability protein
MRRLTIFDVPDDIGDALEARAARHQRTLSAEVRAILHTVIRQPGIFGLAIIVQELAHIPAVTASDVDALNEAIYQNRVEAARAAAAPSEPPAPPDPSPSTPAPAVSFTSPFLTTAEAAQYLRVSEAYLAHHRGPKAKGGPPFLRLGHGIRYRRTDLDAWVVGFDASQR